jgi:hypothetical protein
MNTTWIADRPHLGPLVDRMKELLEVADAMVERAKRDGADIDYAAFEEEVGAGAAAIEAAVHETALSSLDVNAPFVQVWGKTYRRVHRAPRTYGTMAGPVTVFRTLYRPLGERAGPTLDAVGQRAGVVERRWLPRTARAMAFLLGQGTSREAAQTSEELLRLPYSRSSFERVGHTVGAEYVKRRRHVEPRLIEAVVVPDDARAISVAIDRVAVPMEEPRGEGKPTGPGFTEEELALIRSFPPSRPLDARTKAILEEMDRVNAEATPAKVERNYRMAYCAALTLHGPDGEPVHTIRYGRMPPTPGSIESLTKREVQRLMERLADDVRALRGARPDLSVVLLADGAPELWNLFEAHLNEAKLGVAPVQLVDAWHALEYVGAAARLAEARERTMPGTFRRWRRTLLEEDDGAKKLLGELKALELDRVRDDQGRAAVGDAIRYLDSRVARMGYAEARARGLPIGSGTVEATCKSLVALRMKRPGARWKPSTGNEILQLRALQLSDRWSDAMRRTLKPLRKAVRRVEPKIALGLATE